MPRPDDLDEDDYEDLPRRRRRRDEDAYDDDDDDDDHGPVPNYLTQAILVTLCCCMPLGIVAIINASQANSLAGQRKFSQAHAAAGKAKMWCLIAFICGLIVEPIAIAVRIATDPNFR